MKIFFINWEKRMLYTKKGDDGTTKTFNCDKRISKSSDVIEALGSLDEINSFLGLCKVKSKEFDYKINNFSYHKVIGDIQNTLFIVQAELAGFPKTLTEDDVLNLERLTDEMESELPPIKTFFLSGGTELGALFDIARTMARRAERKVIIACQTDQITISNNTKAYLNRLSSILYAFARLSVHKTGVAEIAPEY